MVAKQLVTITRRYEWDMAHRLVNHLGKCCRLHGHRYVLECDATGPLRKTGSSEGMVYDFGDVDECINKAIGWWDHRTMLQDTDPIHLSSDSGLLESELGIFRVPYRPTAENMAIEVMKLLSVDMRVTRVRIYETPKSWAEVRQ